MPEFRELLYLAGAKPRDVARYLGVTERSVFSWLKANKAPRSAMLALYWVSHGGKHELHEELANERAIYYRQFVAARAENERLKQALALHEQHGVYDSANSPSFYGSGLTRPPQQ